MAMNRQIASSTRKKQEPIAKIKVDDKVVGGALYLIITYLFIAQWWEIQLTFHPLWILTSRLSSLKCYFKMNVALLSMMCRRTSSDPWKAGVIPLCRHLFESSNLHIHPDASSATQRSGKIVIRWRKRYTEQTPTISYGINALSSLFETRSRKPILLVFAAVSEIANAGGRTEYGAMVNRTADRVERMTIVSNSSWFNFPCRSRSVLHNRFVLSPFPSIQYYFLHIHMSSWGCWFASNWIHSYDEPIWVEGGMLLWLLVS